MKKIYLFILLAVLAIPLVACDNVRDDRTVISYAAWNLGEEANNNIERRMIAAYEEFNPNVRIDIIERPKIVDEEGNEHDSKWDEFFNAQAAIGKMPDVFQIDKVIDAAFNEWVTDVREIAEADPDFLNVPADIRNAAKYGDKLFALPQALYYHGYFINRTIIKNYAGEEYVPTFGVTFDDLLESAKRSSKKAVLGQDGIIGIDGMSDLSLWLGAQFDDSLGWFGYNGDGYSLNSAAFIRATEEQMKFYNDYNKYSDYVKESAELRLAGSESQTMVDLYGDGNFFETGNQAIRFSPSYDLGHLLAATTDPNTQLQGLYLQDIDYIGTPSVIVDGEKIHRVPVILDYVGIGQGTKHLEEAYDFAKWMSFSPDGYRKRLEIAREFPNAGAVNFAPIVQDDQLLDEYFELYPTLVEFEKLVRNHDNFIIESLAKTVPGFILSRWEGQYDAERNMAAMLDLVRQGEVDIRDIIVNFDERANHFYNEEKERLNQIINK